MNASQDMRDEVRAGYAKIAETGAQTGGRIPKGEGCCGGGPSQGLAEGVGYRPEDLAQLPEGAEMGLSCGNPTALAELRAGEVVLDLGSGGGFDCFLAGPRVGAEGRVIGVDMTHEMLQRARASVDEYRERSGLDNVEFRLGEIEHLPLPDASVDVVLSNCVINLSIDKPQVWREISRVLKPGGRVAVSDVALLKPLPASLVEEAQSWVGCVGGAIPVEETRSLLEAAGFDQVTLEPKPDYVRTLEEMGDPLYVKLQSRLDEGTAPHDLLTSLDIRAKRAG